MPAKRGPPPPPRGVCFPLDAAGKRSTSAVGAATFSAAVRGVDDQAARACDADAAKWRFKYKTHVLKHVEVCARSREGCLTVAQNGLDYIYANFDFVRDDRSMPLVEAMRDGVFPESFETGTVRGNGKSTFEAGGELCIPYKGRELRGPELRAQVDAWVCGGVIEPSCGAALTSIAERKDWHDLTGYSFLMMGASSAMGPFSLLMALGAHVIAVDINFPHVWKRLITEARASAGTLTFPMKARTAQSSCATDEALFSACGCDLISQTPEIRNWVRDVRPSGLMVVGGYAYLDGERFVRIAIAIDAIYKSLKADDDARTADSEYDKSLGLAFLCTPTDCHVVPPEAAAAQSVNRRRAPAWLGLLGMVLPRSCLRPNKMATVRNSASGTAEGSIIDAVIGNQGPNYILAKRLQHWRCMLERERGGRFVSSTIAPSTRTVSVTKNRMFAMAFAGMHNFKPMEIFDEETSRAVMGALLVHDVRNPASSARASAQPLSNPLMLFGREACHGGIWRLPYKFDSIGVPSTVIVAARDYLVKPYLVGYNLVQTAGWGAVLGGLISGDVARLGTWARVGTRLSWYQYLASLEVLHSAFGFVSTPVSTVAVQVFSRLALVDVTAAVPAVQRSPWVTMMVLAWSLTETVRYSFYALNLVGVKVFPLTWLRYTLFTVLYPAGVAGELGTFFSALPALAAGALANTTPMVNAVYRGGAVFGPTLQHVMLPLLRLLSPAAPKGAGAVGVKRMRWFLLLAYGLGLPGLYGHMLRQRKKELGRGKNKAKTA